ncbi:MAG: gephyrin-like molybdotransferase Glp [Methylophilaceae bacterium]
MKKMKINEFLKDKGCLAEYDPNTMSYEKALMLLEQFLTVTKKTTHLPIEEAQGCFLAEDIRSPVNVPNYNNSAMDGYVFRHKFIKPKNNKFKIDGKILAGHPLKTKNSSISCLQIMTGGMIPRTFDTVIPQELVKVNHGIVEFDFKPKVGANIRKIGEDIKKNQVAIKQGVCLNACNIGLLASLGITKVKVFQSIRIGFFSTGDEVIQLGSKIKAGQVYDSNRFLIKAFIKKMNACLVDYGNLSDDKILLENQLKKASIECDLIITTGGVSVGEADYMKEILTKIGQVLFWKMAIKPGRPMAFGKVKKAFYFGLPGNPVSAAVTFLQFVKPSIRFMMGSAKFEKLPYVQLKINAEVQRKKGRKEFVRGIIQRQGKSCSVIPLLQQGSGMLKSMSDANCFIVFDADQDLIRKNSYVNILPFDGII